MIKLVLSDMDGTLVPFGDKRVSAATIEAIDALTQAGVRFAAASGREAYNLLPFFWGRADICSTALAANGKRVIVDGKQVFVRHIDHAQLEALASFANGDARVVLSVFPDDPADPNLYQVGATPQFAEEMSYGDDKDRRIVATSTLPTSPITTAALVMSDPQTGLVCTEPNAEDVASVKREIDELCPGLALILASPFVFDVLPIGWTKVNALDILLEHLGVGLDEVAFFGDSDNDVTLLERIPESYAVAGASPAAAAAARHHIGRCEDSAVAQEMLRIAAEASHAGHTAL